MTDQTCLLIQLWMICLRSSNIHPGSNSRNIRGVDWVHPKMEAHRVVPHASLRDQRPKGNNAVTSE